MSRSVLLVADKLSDRSAVVGALIDTHSVSFLLEQVGLLSEGLERLSQDSAKSIGAPKGIDAIANQLIRKAANYSSSRRTPNRTPHRLALLPRWQEPAAIQTQHH